MNLKLIGIKSLKNNIKKELLSCLFICSRQKKELSTFSLLMPKRLSDKYLEVSWFLSLHEVFVIATCDKTYYDQNERKNIPRYTKRWITEFWMSSLLLLKINWYFLSHRKSNNKIKFSQATFNPGLTFFTIKLNTFPISQYTKYP